MSTFVKGSYCGSTTIKYFDHAPLESSNIYINLATVEVYNIYDNKLHLRWSNSSTVITSFDTSDTQTRMKYRNILGVDYINDKWVSVIGKSD